ncbi:hypothetical protein [Brachyspira catarrhinii]|uniref:hypothetical protein n=1 Tax=Brachyspira catarrhinii TaxID=2528966 RepID=UPI00191DE83A|nr:hypothetical protein [Brachyspira catarrhinii]
MRLLKKITILLCFLSLVAFVSCSAEDKTEITGETGGSGSGGSGSEAGGGSGSGESGSGESGSGSGGGTGESGETGETETTEEGNFPPPEGTYRDPQLSGYANSDTTITIAGGKTTIEGKAKWSGGAQGFKFEVSKWKKTTKGGKLLLKP